MKGSGFLFLVLLFGRLNAESLYDENDNVVELKNEDKVSLASPDKLYVVEFYAHWCGHCIRYSAFWKNLATIFYPWKESIVIGAMNCAEHDCSDYDIPGTPTIKVFRPNSPSPNGIEIHSNKRMVFHDIYDAIRTSRASEPLSPFKYPDLNPFRGESIEEIRDVAFEKSVLLFKEVPELDWSELSVILYSGGSPYNFKIIDSKKKEMARMLDITSRPAVAIIDWSDRRNDKIFLVDLSSYASTFDQVSAFITKNVYGSWEEGKAEEDSFIEENAPDVVYEGDLEKTVKYMLTVEIPMFSLEDQSRFVALRYFLGTLIRYLPLREEIIATVLELRNWMDEQPTINEEQYKAKLNQLIAKNRPFKNTPSEWTGCKGSTPYFRGYPCGLWSLFHVLTVEYAGVELPVPNDTGITSRVVLAIIEYIKHFFSCRNCAENFMKKVDHIGYLPTTPLDTILWLWEIHNMANQNLQGDTTEDPTHPKILWPSGNKCPVCRNSDFQWNRPEVVSYITSVYQKDSIQRIPEGSDSVEDPEEDLVNDILSGSLSSKEDLIERLRKHCLELGN